MSTNVLQKHFSQIDYLRGKHLKFLVLLRFLNNFMGLVFLLFTIMKRCFCGFAHGAKLRYNSVKKLASKNAKKYIVDDCNVEDNVEI